jgi:hypothetical protein
MVGAMLVTTFISLLHFEQSGTSDCSLWTSVPREEDMRVVPLTGASIPCPFRCNAAACIVFH